MPVWDRRRNLDVPLEYSAEERLEHAPPADRVMLALITEGKASVVLNDAPRCLCAPCLLCLNEGDRLRMVENSTLFAQSLSFSPSFLKTRMTFRQARCAAAVGEAVERGDPNPRDTLYPFYERDAHHEGFFVLPPPMVLRVFEKISIIGAEVAAQSDGRWTCRVRRYLLEILNLLEERASAQAGMAQTPVDLVLERIGMRYMEDLTLDDLCRLVHVNRTTLNRLFRQRTGQTVIDYLLSYRLRVARELLAHTGLTIGEIALATGFGIDTYLIRRFTARFGESPTAYRVAVKAERGIVTPART